MRAYYSVFKLRLYHGLQYRAAAAAGIATQAFFGFLNIMVFEAFYSYTTIEPPISLPQLVSYVWLQQAFLVFIVLWFRDNELLQLITSGNIAYELCRPTSLYSFWFAKLLAQRLSSALLRCFPILLFAFVLPKPYRLSLPPDFETFIAFVVALLLGLLVLTAVSMLVYISIFVTLSPTGSILIFGIIGEFLSGMVIPIPLMPDWLQQIVYWLPFRLTADFPFRLYSGHIPLSQAFHSFGLQLLWLAVLIGIGYSAMNSVLRRVVVQGG